MNFNTAAIIDHYVGKFLLNVLSFLARRPEDKIKSISTKSILAIKFWGFGSILEATPLFRNLKQEYPDASLDILTFPENKQLAESLGLFRNVHVIDFTHRGVCNCSA